MIVAGDWLIAPGVQVVANGAVLLNSSRIAAIGDRDKLVRANPRVPVRDHPGCVIMPGMVNAHTHLSLSAMKGLFPPQPFPSWLGSIARVIVGLPPDDFEASAAYGGALSLKAGVTCVGDMAYGPEAPAAAGDTGLGGVFFWEVLGITPTELPATLSRLDFPENPAEQCSGRTRCGLTPHTPYTAGPRLLQAVAEHARAKGIAYAIHVAESPAERELLTAGRGPLAPTAERLAKGFDVPHRSSVEYLDHLGVLDGVIAIHCVHISSREIELLARKARGVVTCPRSNRHLQNGKAPVRALMDAGARVALGTDSLASNDDLDLLAEAHVLRELEPSLTDRELLAMITEIPAAVLGIDDTVGSLTPGHSADVVALHIGNTDDPLRGILRAPATGRVRTVISSGTLRLVNGETAFQCALIERQAARVTERVARAVRLQ